MKPMNVRFRAKADKARIPRNVRYWAQSGYREKLFEWGRTRFRLGTHDRKPNDRVERFSAQPTPVIGQRCSGLSPCSADRKHQFAQSLADFITTTSGFRFSVITGRTLLATAE
jgi:hypothetical protein